MSVLERSVPDRVAITVRDRDGFPSRWAFDEPAAGDVPTGLTISSSLPGGDRELNATLLRERFDAADVEVLNDVRAYGPGNRTLFRGSLTRAPQGDRALSPVAVGMAAELEDHASLVMIPVDRDASKWTAPPLYRRSVMNGFGWTLETSYEARNTEGGLEFLGPNGQAVANATATERVYEVPKGTTSGWLAYKGTQANVTNIEAPTLIGLADDQVTQVTQALTLDGTLRYASAGGGHRYLLLRTYASPAHTPAAPYRRTYDLLAFYGNEGIPLRATESGIPGVYGHDTIRKVIERSNTRVKVTADSIEEDEFVVPHLVWDTPTTPGAALLDVNRFFRKLWGVYDGVLYWRELERFGQVWRTRKSDGARPEAAGVDAELVYNGVIVRYQDALTGTPQIVGPPDSGFTGPSSLSTGALVDTDPENAANAHGRRRWAIIDAGLTTEDGAIRLGYYFLRSLVDRRLSGSIELGGGQIRDELGVYWPAWAIKAGDRLIVEDDSPEPRYIIEANYNRDNGTVSCTLDAAPDTLQAILERLQVVLVGVAS